MITEKQYEKLYPLPDCKVCKNERQIIIDKVHNDKELCDCMDDHLEKRKLALNSHLTYTELQYNFKDYKKIPTDMNEAFEKNDALKVLGDYCKNSEKVIKKNVNLFLHSKSLSMLNLVGVILMNEYIKQMYPVRRYDAKILLNSIRDSFKNQEKYNSEFDDSSNEIHFDTFIKDDSLVFLYDVKFMTITGQTKSKFCELLEQRARNGLLTVIGSYENFYSNKDSFGLHKYVQCNVGDADAAFEQAALLKDFVDE